MPTARGTIVDHTWLVAVCGTTYAPLRADTPFMNLDSSCRLEALGIINALGAGVDAIGPLLFSGDASRLVQRDDLLPERSILVGAVREKLPELSDVFARFRCRNNSLALAALQQIDEPVRQAVERFGAGRVGVVIGSTTAGVAEAGEAVAQHQRVGRLAAGFDYVQLEQGTISAFLARSIGACGPAFTISTACSSGGRALASARRLLNSGVCDAVLAGGCDALCPMTVCGFTALEAVSTTTTRPFSGQRDGLVLGEGAALFLITREPEGIRLLGAGDAAEAHHMSAPHPDGLGAAAALQAALADAGAAPADIAYLNLHGTGTLLNDAMESKAVQRVLGNSVPCSSTKPLVGHTLGAAGAMEAGFLWMSLAAADGGHLPLPPHVWDGVPDPELPALNFIGVSADRHRGVRALDGWTLLASSSFAFGGDNIVLVIGVQQ